MDVNQYEILTNENNYSLVEVAEEDSSLTFLEIIEPSGRVYFSVAHGAKTIPWRVEDSDHGCDLVDKSGNLILGTALDHLKPLLHSLVEHLNNHTVYQT